MFSSFSLHTTNSTPIQTACRNYVVALVSMLRVVRSNAFLDMGLCRVSNLNLREEIDELNMLKPLRI